MDLGIIAALDVHYGLIYRVLYVILVVNFGIISKPIKHESIQLKPIVIGFVTNLLLMPLISYAIGWAFFSDEIEMQLGLFTAGISVVGATSTCWTVLIGGCVTSSNRINLINTLLSFGTSTIWLATIGKTISGEDYLQLYHMSFIYEILIFIVPFGVGTQLQHYIPQLVVISSPLTKILSLILILLTITFSTFRGFSLFMYLPLVFRIKLICAALTLTIIGYFFGWSMAWLLKLKQDKALAIAVSPFSFNLNIAHSIFICINYPLYNLAHLFYATIVAMTPIPVMLYFLGRLVIKCSRKKNIEE